MMTTTVERMKRMPGMALVWLAGLWAVSSGTALGGENPQKHKYTNRLIKSASPYLLQHAHNPVDWYPWSDEAFERARKEKKPIFLSIGYAACHWCHVMERESFENEEIAAILNEHFIAIKVDREERPDVDEVFMAATIAATGRGGWPMSIFMTADHEPFMCGTYFPPESRGSRRGFRELITDIAEQWATDRQALTTKGQLIVSRVVQQKGMRGHTHDLDRKKISQSVDRIVKTFDPVLGGRRTRSTKFPPTMAMELMLREYATQRDVSKPHLVELVETTLRRMAGGGIYDQIGGGICRYSTDPRWFAPHFEKMLYDQATVSGVYLSAYQLTRNEFYARVARGILDYCIRDMQSPEGGFYSSLDADSEGEEGKFYVWRRAEIDELLPAKDAALFNEYYNVTERGNWHNGRNILHVKVTDEDFARQHQMDEAAWRKRLDGMKKILFDARSKRVPPPLDDKILAEWNGLLITQMARAYRILDEPRYRDSATRAADFILGNMVKDGRLYRAHRAGKTYIPGVATDYTDMVEALITLYETTFDRKWLSAAERLNDAFVKHFFDEEEHGFFYTAHDAEKLMVRSKSFRDSVVPSVNSVAPLNFLRLKVLLGRDDQLYYAEETLKVTLALIEPRSLERAQWAGIFYHEHPREIAIIGDPNDPNTQALIAEAYKNYYPNKVVASCRPEEATSEDALPLLKRKTLVRGKPGAYVCRDYICGRPVTTPADLAKQLEEAAPHESSPE